MSVSCPANRQAARAFTIIAALAAWPAAMAFAASAKPVVHTLRGCYLVGQRVTLVGSGFAPTRAFDVSIEGVDFGQSTTSSAGGFSVQFLPGGLPAGPAQHVEHLDASDGTSSADTTFTLTRRSPGARFLSSGGNPNTLRAPFEVWSFATDGSRKTVYLHYINPAGAARMTVRLGRTAGQCGYLLTRSRRVFPFNPSVGNWTLQLDTIPGYTRFPRGPVARIGVRLS